VSALWQIDLETGTVSQFTSGTAGDTTPRWSPDGSRIAFLSDRAKPGTTALYTISASGGEAVLHTTWKGGISTFAWSPNGDCIAFLGKDAKTEEDERREKEREDHVVREREFKFDRLYVVDAAGGEPRLLSREGATHVADLSWMPDGSGVVALHLRTPLADEWQGPSDLILYSLDENTPPKMVMHCDEGIADPRVSPDGVSVAFRAKAGRVTALDQLWTVPLSGGDRVLLTRNYAGTIDAHRWAPDSGSLHFVAFEDLWGALRSVDRNGEAISPLLAESEERCGSFDPSLGEDGAGQTIAVVRNSSTSPPEVWVGQVGGTLTPRTTFNENLRQRRLSTAEPIQWTSDDVEIHGLLLRPVGYAEGTRYPLVTHVHGGPAWLWSDRWLADWHDWAQLLAQRGFAVLLPNPRGSTGRGSAFTDANVNDLGGGEFRDMMRGVDAVIAMGIADPERLGVGGWSWGGYMTAWTVSQTNRFTCAIMGAGLSNLASDQGQNDVPRMNDDYFDVSPYEEPQAYLQRSAITYVRNATTPTLILHGEKDERVAIPQAWEMYRGLQWAGVKVEMVTYPREGHPIKERAHQIDLLTRVLDWFGRHLSPGAASIPEAREVVGATPLQ
jgi:dipeptidyl aminopeptidase/acylaminoacyl peptidase